MNEEIKIVSVEKPEWGIIGGGIHNYNIQQAGEDNGQTMCFVILKDQTKKLSGRYRRNPLGLALYRLNVDKRRVPRSRLWSAPFGTGRR